METRTVVERGEEGGGGDPPNLSYCWDGGREKCENNKCDEENKKQ